MLSEKVTFRTHCISFTFALLVTKFIPTGNDGRLVWWILKSLARIFFCFQSCSDKNGSFISVLSFSLMDIYTCFKQPLKQYICQSIRKRQDNNTEHTTLATHEHVVVTSMLDFVRNKIIKKQQ